jgi:hypothetical protein
MKRLILPVLFGLFLLGYAVSAGELEGVPDKWRVGRLGIYIFQFPYPRTEVINETVVVSPSTIRGDLVITLAVWGVSEDNPIEIRLDGRVIKQVTRPGYYVVTEKVIGSHHVAVMCRYKVFEEAVFYAVPPPPPPPTIPLAEFLKRLKEQREQVITYMIFSIAGAIPLAIQTKKKTKIKTDYVLIPPAILAYFGYNQMADHYYLLSFSVAYALTYYLAREYADYLGVLTITRNGIITKTYPTDDEGNIINEISLRRWREGFIVRKELELIDPYPIYFEYRGERLKTVIAEKFEETHDKIKIKCDPKLARALVEAGIIEQIQSKLAGMEFRVLIYERTFKHVLTWAIRQIESWMLRTELDKIARLEGWETVKKKAEEIAEIYTKSPREILKKLETEVREHAPKEGD